MCQRINDDGWHRLSPEDTRHFKAYLHLRDLRLTPQRQLVYEVVAGSPRHICAEHILENIRQRDCRVKINLATVYRTLDLFISIGLITEHLCPGDRSVYEAASGGKHSHLWCRKCKALLPLESDWARSLQKELLNEYEFEVEVEKHPIIGLCALCRNTGSSVTTRSGKGAPARNQNLEREGEALSALLYSRL
jgi:Fe2+ or Zn2+ uptake regulation protein